jgi:hypothetical protein
MLKKKLGRGTGRLWGMVILDLVDQGWHEPTGGYPGHEKFYVMKLTLGGSVPLMPEPFLTPDDLSPFRCWAPGHSKTPSPHIAAIYISSTETFVSKAWRVYLY